LEAEHAGKEFPGAHTLHLSWASPILADGKERWVAQINLGDVWSISTRSYDPKEGRCKDQSIGDTHKVYTIPEGAWTGAYMHCGGKLGRAPKGRPCRKPLRR
jgi:hypothetical protein